MSATAFITPRLAKWARERTRHSVEEVAEKIRADAEHIMRWEHGDALPTFREAQRLARALSIPFGYLYLSAPPKQHIPLPDFRTLPSPSVLTPSAEFVDLLNDVLLKQDWYRDYLSEEGGSVLKFVGRFTTENSIDQVANDIRATLGINEDLRRGCAGPDAFLVALAGRAEAAGILVMRSGIEGKFHRSLSVDEFRGFAISDVIAPLVFINTQDAKAAQIFTLIHELVHIWVGMTGISNPGLQSPIPDANKLERFCNNVAADVLVPAADLVARWVKGLSAIDNIRALSKHYHVSSLVLLRRAYDQGKLTNNEYNKLYGRAVRRFESTISKVASRGGFYASLYARNGNILTAALVTAALERRILLRDAAQMLGVKVPTLQKIADRLVLKGSLVPKGSP